MFSIAHKLTSSILSMKKVIRFQGCRLSQLLILEVMLKLTCLAVEPRPIGLICFSNGISMEGRRMNQVPLFSSARELGNLMVTSNLIDSALTKILELQRDQTALLSSVQYRVFYPSPKCTIVAFVSSPDCTQNPLPGQGDLVPSPLFDFLCTEEYKSVSINRAALTLFTSFHDHLSGLKTQLTQIEGQLIITGHSLGGSVASLFTLCLLDGNLLKPNCRPFCITFGSPLIGGFGLQHSIWNSFFLHVVSNQDPVPGLFLPSGRGRSTPTSSHSQTTGYKPFGTYLLCSELGCACLEKPDLILGLLKVRSSEVAGGLQDVDYGEILRNLKERAICKGLQQVGERFADPFTAGIIMDLEIIGFDQTKLLQHNIDIETVISTMEEEARNPTKKNKAFDAKILNHKKKDMAGLEWYKKKSKDLNKGYYDCFKNQGSKRDIKIEQYGGHLTLYWKDMVAQVQRKPQKEGATFRTRWLYAGTVYRRMVEPLDIAAFYVEGGTDYMKNERSLHYKLLQQWYEEDVKPPSKDKLDSKKQKVSGILTEDSCFWAHVEEAILSCELLKSENCTLEQEKSSWDNLVKFEEYVMEQINNYAVSPEIFLGESSFMKWWGLYEGYIYARSNSHRSPLISFMKNGSYTEYR
ncbi:senescence-associated carboxylesterase 101 isoform X1 [Vitis vinifera]|uniref:senescence-associated carboxylesterase 101 isoform X1 n=2 Tax=Vitis vinifera TaxID=29760 RepID=UPI0005402CDE|nr:senescence-associated carboxylesterase 101 isoform X1 [Vitis vinifera]|eukprot:XP_010660963.1 PREDICTED: senescence-associated carboxylesterase 101 isoform X1 [Vitis vinifera]